MEADKTVQGLAVLPHLHVNLLACEDLLLLGRVQKSANISLPTAHAAEVRLVMGARLWRAAGLVATQHDFLDMVACRSAVAVNAIIAADMSVYEP